MDDIAELARDPDAKGQWIERESRGQHLPYENQRELDPGAVRVFSFHEMPCRRFSGDAGRTLSIRWSGMSQINAAATKIPSEIHGENKVAPIAPTYSSGESLPFQSRPTAFFKIE